MIKLAKTTLKKKLNWKFIINKNYNIYNNNYNNPVF